MKHIYYLIVTTARANGPMPIRHLEWVPNEMPNTLEVEDPETLGQFMSRSNETPESCKLTPAESAAPDPMTNPLFDVDPHALSEE